MQRKEALYAVIGGVVGAVLTMAAGSFSPLGAQDGAVDLNVGEITCTGLKVVDEASETRVWLRGMEDEAMVGVYDKDARVIVRAREHVRGVLVFGKNGKPKASMIDRDGQDGGLVGVSGKDGEAQAIMGVVEDGGMVTVRSKDSEVRAIMSAEEHGGMVSIHSKNGEGRAAMSVSEYGNGMVITLDKNGYPLAALE